MGKISQADASQAATKIAEPINKKSIEIETSLREYVTEIYKVTLPAEILKMYEKHSEYIKTTYSVKITGTGIKERSVSLMGALPADKQESYTGSDEYYTKIHLSNEQSKKAGKLIDAKEDMSKKYKDTRDEIERTILNLNTHKRVLEQFPEAYGALPGVNTNTQLTVQLQPVRDKVKCLISDDKEKKCIETL